MKDSEFIELLNLYLDHEISASDAVRLEAEVQGNAARRGIYQDYCRMQKACKVLALDFQTEAPAVPERKVIPFEPAAGTVSRPVRAARASGFYTFGTLVAAAACVAVILLSRSSPQGPVDSAPGLAQAGSAVPVQAVAAAPASVQVEAGRQPLVGSQLFLSGKAQSDALHVAANEEANARFAWMSSVQLAPLPTDSALTEPLRFETRQKTEPAVYSSPQPLDIPVHSAAFRFQK